MAISKKPWEAPPSDEEVAAAEALIDKAEGTAPAVSKGALVSRVKAVARNPNWLEEITELSPRMKGMIEFMVFGLSRRSPYAPDLPLHTALSVENAARAIGIRVRLGRRILAHRLGDRHYLSLLAEKRKNQRAINLDTLISVRDDVGDNSAATKLVRLKAAALIEGDGTGRANSQTNVNVQVNNTNVTPGYVIDLSEFPAGDDGIPMITSANPPRRTED